jgi:hypothetical protein
MAISFDQFMYGIGYQETRGRKDAYHVVNAYGAVGKYQVLKSNVPDWSRRVLGHSITWQQFRDSPALQEQIVRGILKGYFNAWGARGAAAAWYAGPGNHSLDMSTRPQNGGPSIKTYVDQVLGWAGGSSGEVGSSFSGMGAVTPQLTDDERAEQYGLSMRLINSSKELKNLFKQAVAGSWSSARFAASLKNTKWWRSQSDSLRKYVTLKITDPATWAQNNAAAAAKLNRLAVQVGLGNQIFQAGPGKGQANALLKQAIYNSLALGWSDERIKDWMGTKVSVHGGIMWGEAGEAFDKLHGIAYLNGQKYSDAFYKATATNVAAGRATLEQYEAQIRREAAARYSAFSEQILAGQNAMDLAAPYIKSVSSLLELPETDVDLFNSHVASAMTKSTPLWQFENDLRADPLWRKTNNARESMFTVAHQVAKDFGLAF